MLGGGDDADNERGGPGDFGDDGTKHISSRALTTSMACHDVQSLTQGEDTRSRKNLHDTPSG